MISSLIPAVKSKINAEVIASTIDKSEPDKMSAPKKDETKNEPKEIPRPPRYGVFWLCELLSFGTTIIFLK